MRIVDNILLKVEEGVLWNYLFWLLWGVVVHRCSNSFVFLMPYAMDVRFLQGLLFFYFFNNVNTC
jgi:hypothetical protein